MKNTDFMNLSLPEGADKIDVEILNNDFKKLENEASKHYIKQQIEVDGTATIIGSIGPYVQLENLTDEILNVSIGDELVILMKGDNRKIRTISGENYGVVTNGAVRITYYINARTYVDENFYKKEKVDELLVEATVEVDAELSETSENPVQNKVITAELASYATTAEVESKVTEKVAEIVAGAPEDFDTLKEMSDWLNEHEDSAATMNSAIQKNATDITTANANIAKNVEDIETANANIQKNIDDISAVNAQITDIYNRCGGGKNLFKNKHSVDAVKTVGEVTIKIISKSSFTVTTGGNPTTSDRDFDLFGAYGTTANKFPRGTYKIKINGIPKGCSVYLLSGTVQRGVMTRENSTVGIAVSETDSSLLLTGILFRVHNGYSVDNEQTIQILITPETVKNLTFVDYIPTNAELQEQINTLLARIEALETATTTEGGE